MTGTSLINIYRKTQSEVQKVFVVPLIRFNYKDSDYLYLLYKELINNNSDSSINITNISALGHVKFVIYQLFKGRSILHYHWLEFQDVKSLLGMPYKLAMIWLFLLFGGKVVWTIHNLTPHDKKYLKLHKTIHTWMAKKSSYLLVHSSYASTKVQDYLNADESTIIVYPHPKFPVQELNNEIAVQQLQSELLTKSLSDSYPTLLMFGAISEYKGIREIVSTLSELEGSFNLIIAGYIKKGSNALLTFLIEESEKLDWLHVIPSFIKEEHIPVLLNASDICVFNFDDIFTSGSIEMALSYKKRIIAPRLEALQQYEENPLVQFFDSQNNLKKVFKSLISTTPSV